LFGNSVGGNVSLKWRRLAARSLIVFIPSAIVGIDMAAGVSLWLLPRLATQALLAVVFMTNLPAGAFLALYFHAVTGCPATRVLAAQYHQAKAAKTG
jgi:hypothetical protein